MKASAANGFPHVYLFDGNDPEFPRLAPRAVKRYTAASPGRVYAGPCEIVLQQPGPDRIVALLPDGWTLTVHRLLHAASPVERAHHPIGAVVEFTSPTGARYTVTLGFYNTGRLTGPQAADDRILQGLQNAVSMLKLPITVRGALAVLGVVEVLEADRGYPEDRMLTAAVEQRFPTGRVVGTGHERLALVNAGVDDLAVKRVRRTAVPRFSPARPLLRDNVHLPDGALLAARVSHPAAGWMNGRESRPAWARPLLRVSWHASLRAMRSDARHTFKPVG